MWGVRGLRLLASLPAALTKRRCSKVPSDAPTSGNDPRRSPLRAQERATVRCAAETRMHNASPGTLGCPVTGKTGDKAVATDYDAPRHRIRRRDRGLPGGAQGAAQRGAVLPSATSTRQTPRKASSCPGRTCPVRNSRGSCRSGRRVHLLGLLPRPPPTPLRRRTRRPTDLPRLRCLTWGHRTRATRKVVTGVKRPSFSAALLRAAAGRARANTDPPFIPVPRMKSRLRGDRSVVRFRQGRQDEESNGIETADQDGRRSDSA